MNQPPSLKRGFAVYGISFVLMLVVSVLFYTFKSPKAGLNIPWLSVAISIAAVFAPAAIACYWPKNRAPGGLPSYRPPSPWLIAAAAFLSLPLYIVFAACQIELGHLFALRPDTSLVQPLTSSGPLAFLGIWLSIAVLPAATEETLYRGVMQSSLVARLGPLWGIVSAACLFSLAHMDLTGGPSRILMGLWFGFLYWRTGSLLPGIVAHGLNNTWGVVLANWARTIEGHLPYVYGFASLSAIAGLACLYQGGALPWKPVAPPSPAAPALPRVVPMARPREEH